jgi:hypothetical protein
LVLEPLEQNNDTILTLFGRDTNDWGSYFYSNLLMLLENSCNSYAPGYAGQLVPGQLWFDTDTETLKVCTHSNPVGWKVIANATPDAISNVVTYDNVTSFLKHYIPLTGSTTRMTGALVLAHMDNTSSGHTLATNQYVQYVADKITQADKQQYVHNAGDTILSTVHLPNVFTTGNCCATKAYIDDHALLSIAYDNHVGIIWDSSGYNTAYDDLVIARIPRQANELVIINGSIFIKRGRAICNLTLPVAYLTTPFVLLSGGLHEEKEWVDKTDDITYNIIDNQTISIERATVDLDERVYFTITGICITNPADFLKEPVTVSIDGEWLTYNNLIANIHGLNLSKSKILSYKWYKTPSLTPVGLDYAFTPKDTGVYIVKATYKDEYGNAITVESEPATIRSSIDEPGKITLDPQSSNGTTTLVSTLTDPNDPIFNTTYQWYKDGVAITPAVTTKDYVPTTPGKYKVGATYTDGLYNTSTVYSEEYEKKAIPVEDPGWVEISGADNLTGTVQTATLHDPNLPVSDVKWQWYKDGVAITGATAQTYTPPINGQGEYSVKATYSDTLGGVVTPNQVAWSEPRNYQVDPAATNDIGVLTITGKDTLAHTEQTAVLHDKDHTYNEKYTWYNKADTTKTILSTSAKFTPDKAGTYVATVTYNDDFHNDKTTPKTETATTEVTITAIANNPASIVILPDLNSAGEMVSKLTDADGVVDNTVKYTWSVKSPKGTSYVDIAGSDSPTWKPTMDGGQYRVCADFTDGMQNKEHVCSDVAGYAYSAPVVAGPAADTGTGTGSGSSGTTPPADTKPTVHDYTQDIEDLKAITDPDEFSSKLDEVATKIEKDGLMSEYESKLDSAADVLTQLYNSDTYKSLAQ